MLAKVEVTNSLEKIQCRCEKDWQLLNELVALRGECISFQVAIKTECPAFVQCHPLTGSVLAEFMHIRFVESVPCYHPAPQDDTYVLTHTPSLLPDPLQEQNFLTRSSRGNWHAFHVLIRIPESAPAGRCLLQLQVEMRAFASNESQILEIPLTIINVVMPRTQDFRFTNWFYADCVFKQHHVRCWSQKHWQLLQQYFENYADHGSNMLLTPLWTLPLGVEKGKHRPLCQLLIIREKAAIYQFDFSRLEHWIDLAVEAGIETFEMAHAYSQWGANSSPYIVIENSHGISEMRFGWHTPANSFEYQNFLKQLMPQLLTFLRKKNLQKRCYFHISDEPKLSNLDSYKEASSFFTPLVQEFPIIDALSDVEFYQKGLVECPVPSTKSLKNFFKENILSRWTYYCSGTGCMPNRYIGLPSIRNRILGLILYFYDLNGGFLHWGYNGHYTRQSWSYDIDPWQETDWGRFGNSGCSFLVYPGNNGPVDSIRHEVFREAVQDYRILRFLEQQIGRERILSLIQESLPQGHSFALDDYPRDNEWFFKLRNEIYLEFNKL